MLVVRIAEGGTLQVFGVLNGHRVALERHARTGRLRIVDDKTSKVLKESDPLGEDAISVDGNRLNWGDLLIVLDQGEETLVEALVRSPGERHSSLDPAATLELGRSYVSQNVRKAAEHLAAVREGRYFAGVLIDSDEIVVGNDRFPLSGATASVEAGGQITQRLTATRLATLGKFALAAPKKRDRRELYLAVEGPTFSFVVPLDPDLGRAAHAFAARISDAGKRSNVSVAPTLSATAAEPNEILPPSAGIDAITAALERLQGLHGLGAITDDEYTEMRREVLRRV